jgi:hypothetical protein
MIFPRFRGQRSGWRQGQGEPRHSVDGRHPAELQVSAHQGSRHHGEAFEHEGECGNDDDGADTRLFEELAHQRRADGGEGEQQEPEEGGSATEAGDLIGRQARAPLHDDGTEPELADRLHQPREDARHADQPVVLRREHASDDDRGGPAERLHGPSDRGRPGEAPDE